MQIDDGDFKQLIGLLQKLVENQATSVNSDNLNKPEDKPKKKTRQNKTKKKTIDNDHDDDQIKESVLVTKSRSYRPAFVNKFTDMAESGMHKEDTIIDKKLNRLPPSQRTRRYEPISVSCRVCGRKEKVNPVFVESVERYKCNKCATSAG